MTVYIEYVIIDNMVLNSLICFITLKSVRSRVLTRFWATFLRVVLVSALGTAIAILLPLLDISGGLLIVARLATAFLLVILLDSYKNIAMYLKALLAFVGVTFLLGGACFGILFLLEGDFERAVTLGYQGFPVGIVVLGAVLAYAFAVAIVRRVQFLRHTQPFVYRVKLFLRGECVELLGYLDSGNLLYDRGAPVVVADRSAVAGLVSEFIVAGGVVRDIKIDTVSGAGSMRGFRPDRIEVYYGTSVNTLYDITVGLTDRAFAGEYSCLLHPAMMN